MVSKGMHHIPPIVPSLWRRSVALVSEDPIAAAGERLRHETQFYKGVDSVVQHEIVDLVHVKKIEFSGTCRSDPHLVVEETVAPDGLHSRVALHSE